MPVVDQSMLLQQAYTPGDKPAVQAAKLQQLWIWLQAYQEHVSPGNQQLLPHQHQDLTGAQDIQQNANAAAGLAIPVAALKPGDTCCGARSSPQLNVGASSPQQHLAPHRPGRVGDQEQHQLDDAQHISMSIPQQHQPAHPRQLLGTDSTDDPAPADMQQPADQGQHSLPRAGAMLAPPPAQQLISHKDLLTRLLLPRQGHSGPAGAGAGTGVAAASTHAEHNQQQQHAPGQGRQRRLQQNRNILQGVHGGESATAAAQQRLQQLGIGWGQQHNEESPGPLEQQQMLRMRAQYLFDAQSQAPGATAAPAAAALQRPCLGLHQQLFSPRTATHAPVVCAGSNSAGPAGSSLQQSQSPIAAPTPAAPKQQQQMQEQGQQMDADLEAEQPDEIEVTPLLPCGVTAKAGTATHAATAHAATAQQQHWGSGVPTAAGAAAGGCALLPPTAATPDALADPSAAAAAGAAAVACASAVETPATMHTELVAGAASYRAAAAAAAGLAAALFHTPGPGALGDRAPRDVSGEAPGEAVQAGLQALEPLDCVAQSEETLGETPTTQLQHLSSSLGPTPPSQQQVASVTPPMAAAAAAEAATQAAAVGGIGFVAGSTPVDETQPPCEQQQRQHDTGVLDSAAQVKPPSRVAAAASNSACAVRRTPAGNMRKSADAAALMLPPPPVPVLAMGVKSPAVGLSLQAGARPGVGPRSGSPARQQQQRLNRPGPSPLNPALKRQGAFAAAAAADCANKPGREAKAGRIGHTVAVLSSTAGRASFELRKVPQQLQSRLRELHLGAPVVHVMASSGYAVAVLQSAAASGMHQLLLLEVAQKQQCQQQEAKELQDKVPQQQQHQPPAVVVSAEYTSAFVGPARQLGALSARRTSASPQQQGCVNHDLLRTGLLLLPLKPQTTAQGELQSGPLLVVASGLQLQSEAPGSAAATAAAVTPADTLLPPKLAALQGGGGSSAKRKLPGAGSNTSPHTGTSESSHAVTIHQLKHSFSSMQLADCQAGQHTSTGAELVQSLPVGRAMRCLAVCEQPGLLAAAGSGGFACVWPLQASRGAETVSAAGNNVGSGQGPVADAWAVIELPAACYKGVVFPDISELCFIVQGTNTPSASGQGLQSVGGTGSGLQQQPSPHRVLLIGASSQGSIAVWDVQRRQQVIAVHCPDLRLSSLMAPAPHAAEATLAAALRQQAAAAGSGAAGAAPCTQQAGGGGCEPVVCLATVRSIDSNTSRGGLQGLAQLRAVVLHSNGELQLGVPLLVAGHQGGISAATLMGTTAAAATAAGTLKVWDIFSGKRRIVLKPAPGAANSSVVGALALMCVPHGSVGSNAAGMGAGGTETGQQQAGQLQLLLAGSASGVTTAVVF